MGWSTPLHYVVASLLVILCSLLVPITLLLIVWEGPFYCRQTVDTNVLLICVCAAPVTLALFEGLAGLDSRLDRGIVAALVLALSRPG